MTMNSDVNWSGPLYSSNKLAHMVSEASRSTDPDVLTALENLEEVLARSQARARNANRETMRASD